ncbi:MAG: 16S rRNA (guanine(527)-N(7))-methyltransferase RsmG [Oscillospiraceae bacterium]
MSINKDRLIEMCKEYSIEISEQMANKLSQYADMLVEWNEKVNLTAITEYDEIEVKHFLDSLLLLAAVDIPKGSSMIDVGTGAGFPSVPCSVIRGDIKLTLLDSLNKRINFLTELCQSIGVKAECVHSRAEDGGHNKKLREKYDIATARAVARLRELAEYCMPFVKVGGYFIALKGYDCEEEVKEAKSAISQLGGEIVDVKKYNLPMDNKRAIIIIKKISQTPTSFPRKAHVMAKKPII